MFLWQQPSEQTIARFLETSKALPLSYAPVGIAAENPEGFTVDEADVVVGHGAGAFTRARQALLDWAHFDLDGYPITRLIQARFRFDSGRAMQRAVAQRG